MRGWPQPVRLRHAPIAAGTLLQLPPRKKAGLPPLSTANACCQLEKLGPLSMGVALVSMRFAAVLALANVKKKLYSPDATYALEPTITCRRRLQKMLAL